MSKKFKILILGYGEMGHAMEHLLHKQHDLFIWDKYPQENFQSVSLEETASSVDIVIFCLPVNPHQEIAEGIAPLLKPDCLCLSIAKGLDEAGHTAAEIFNLVFDQRQPYGLLYGPMISEEIRANRYAFAQIACNKTEYTCVVEQLFSESILFTEATTDIDGISWSVILKNVYALVFGMADELKLGDNTRGFLAVVALHELDEIVLQMGGERYSPYHLAGLGDLITTATSEDSHHHELGRKLARDETQNIKGEGIHTLEMVNKYQLFNRAHFPLFDFIHNIVAAPKDVRQQFDQYIKKQNAANRTGLNKTI